MGATGRGIHLPPDKASSSGKLGLAYRMPEHTAMWYLTHRNMDRNIGLVEGSPSATKHVFKNCSVIPRGTKSGSKETKILQANVDCDGPFVSLSFPLAK